MTAPRRLAARTIVVRRASPSPIIKGTSGEVPNTGNSHPSFFLVLRFPKG